MQVVPDSGWFASLGRRPSNAPFEAVVLIRLRNGLRGLYQDQMDEPLPERLAALIRELEQREPANDRQPE